jgi:hypothetical protein
MLSYPLLHSALSTLITLYIFVLYLPAMRRKLIRFSTNSEQMGPNHGVCWVQFGSSGMLRDVLCSMASHDGTTDQVCNTVSDDVFPFSSLWLCTQATLSVLLSNGVMDKVETPVRWLHILRQPHLLGNAAPLQLPAISCIADRRSRKHWACHCVDERLLICRASNLNCPIRRYSHCIVL